MTRAAEWPRQEQARSRRVGPEMCCATDRGPHGAATRHSPHTIIESRDVAMIPMRASYLRTGSATITCGQAGDRCQLETGSAWWLLPTEDKK